MKIIKKIWSVLFIVLFWFIFAFPYLFQNLTVFPSTYLVNFFSPWNAYPGFASPVKNGAMPDIISQIYPWKVFTIQTLKSGQIPFWNPYSFSGTLHLSNYQSAVLTPFNLLFFILPFLTAWNFLVLLQPLLAGIFMYLYVRSLKLPNFACLISSISFMFCGFLTTWMGYATLGYAILYLPLALFAIEKYFETNHHKYLFLLSLTFPLSFFSGHFQISIYFAVLVFTYIIFKSLISRNKKYLIFGLVYFFIGILFTLPQVLPSIEAYLQSLRSSIFIKAEIIPWGYLPTFLAPDFYGNPVTRNDWFGHYAEWNGYIGLIPLMLGFYSLKLIKKNKYILYFLIISIITILLSFQSPFINFLVFLKIPVISTSAASRIIVIFSFSFAVMAGFGFEKLFDDIRQKKIKSIFSWLIIFAIIFASLWAIIFLKLFLPLDKIIVARQNLILPTVIFFSASVVILISLLKVHFLKNFPAIFLPLILILLVAFDMYRFVTKWMPQDPQNLVYPKIPIASEFSKLSGYDRFLSNLGGEATIYYKLPSLEGYDAVYNQRYGEFISSLNDGKVGESARSVVLFPKEGFYAPQSINLLNVKYVIYKKADDHASWTFPFWSYKDGTFKLIYDDESYQILENEDVFPRAFFVDKFQIATESQTIINKMFNSDLQKEVILEENPGQKITGTGEAEIISYTPDKVSIQATTNGNSLLFLSDSFSKDWTAKIDGNVTKIYRADYDFRAIFVPKGKHEIVFEYDPTSFKWGFLLAILGFILLVGVETFRKGSFKFPKLKFT